MEGQKYKEAKKRVEDIKGFYGHLFAYIGVNITLIAINLVTSPGSLWFYWVTIFWGIGLFWHAMGVFVFNKFPGRKWEDKKIKEIMEEMDEE
ncbi:MAG: 2TM domain-containing protein [Actinomycetota bacterium]